MRNFTGTNAAVYAQNGGRLNIKNSKINTAGKHANAVFAYGEKSVIGIADSTINTTENNSGGIMVTGGGSINATNLTIETKGRSSAAIRSDRGGGTINVIGGKYSSYGSGSPAIYSTADITVKDATLYSDISEAVVIEGKNSVTLNNVTAIGKNTVQNSDNTDKKKAVMIYQSMSGDASEGKGQFTMNGGGHAFVCDGYDENGFFHYNWGWSGMGNGYFKSSALNVYDYKFNSGQSIVVGIQIPEDIWQDDGWQEYGTGTYGFTCLGNDRQSLNVFGRVSKDGQYQELKVSDWGKGVLSDDGVEVRFVINHATDEVTIPPFNTGYYLDIDSTSFQVCGADVSSSPVYDDPYSVYDFRSRTIRVKMAYYSFTGPSEWVVYNPAIEVFKLPENTPVYMRKVVFDDAAAEAAAVAQWDTDKDGKLNYSEIWAVTDIGDAFAGDSSIVSLDVLSEFSNLRVIPENAFSMCKALERLNIPESVNEIGAGAFSGCGSLKTLALPQGMRDVPDRMCEDCVSLISLSLPDSLTSIGSRAFRNCKSLREIVIPETVRSIGEMALAGCGNLFVVQVRWSNPLSGSDKDIRLTQSSHILSGTSLIP